MINPIVRWIPAIVVPVVIVAAAVIVPAAADAFPRLPEKSAQEVLAMIANSGDAHYAGTFVQSSNLGLPEIPAMGQGSSASPASSALELLAGSRTVRVFVGADDSVRLQLMDQLAQRDVISAGSEVWTYDSQSNATTHLSVTPEARAALQEAGLDDSQAGAVLPDAATTPSELTQKLLDAIDPSTTVVVGDSARVAGRAAYTLTLTPRNTDTLVASATLAIDADTGLPLSATVMAVGQADAALSIAFSSIEFGEQDPSLFAFTAPAGSAVSETVITADDVAAKLEASDASRSDATIPSAEQPTVIGTGWSTVVALPGGQAALDAGSADGTTDDAGTAQLLDQLTTAVAGGRMLQTSLFSIFFADDGRVFAGAVGVDALVAAAQR